MPNTFKKAPAVAEIGKALIREHHRDLIKHAVRVEFLFCSDTPRRGGKNVWGQVKKISSLSAYLPHLYMRVEFDEGEEADANEPFFVVIVPEEIWDRIKATHRKPLIDSLLMRCAVKEDKYGSLAGIHLVDPDYVGFHAEMSRYGLWRREAREHYDAMKRATDPQGKFAFDEPATNEGEVTVRTQVLGAVH